MRSCLASALLAAVLLAACVRNPVPESPAASPAAVPDMSSVGAPPPATTRRAPHQHPFPAAGRRAVPLFLAGRVAVRTWRGLRVLPRDRCPGYDATSYTPVAHVPRLPDSLARGWRDPLTCSWFRGRGDPDVVPARIVPPGVAHDAGLCGAGPELVRAFAFDPENTVYLPRTVAALRRYLADVGGPQWLPAANPCWYVEVQLRVRRRYDLSVTPDEVRAFEAVLRTCPVSRRTPYCGGYGGAPAVPARRLP